MSIKKCLVVAIVALAFLIKIPVATAMQVTSETLLEQINYLLLIIQDLQEQIVALKSKQATQQQASSTTPVAVKVISPNTVLSFKSGESIKISWSGGGEKVQIGLVNNSYDTDKSVLGWISLNEKPNSSLTWNGADVTDLTGIIKKSVSSLSAGPYKIIAVSSNLAKKYCVQANGDCNYDLSDSYFNLSVPEQSDSLSVICSAKVGSVPAGSAVTWEASALNAESPYSFRWSGTDGISELPTRFGSDGKFLDVVYNATGEKIAEVVVKDATGKESKKSCKSPVTITQALSSLTLISPNGGENFVLTKVPDPSQFVKVSWKSRTVFGLKDEKIKIALQDSGGILCEIGSVSRRSNDASLGLVDGYICPNNNRALVPGQYKLKIYLEGRENIDVDTSDSYFTLSEPVSNVQMIIPSESTIDSGKKVKFHFYAPSNIIKATLSVSCPAGIKADIPNVCDKYTDVTSYITSNSDYTVGFSNSSFDSKKVSVNYYVYLPNNPSYGRGVRKEITVLPVSPSVGNAITVLAPNGDEKIYYGNSFVYRFRSNQAGSVDLTLVPYPPIDAGLVCQIATGVSAPLGEFTFAVPSNGACPNNSANILSGKYQLLATLREGSVKLATDLSDSSFTISATSTVSN